MLDKTSGYIPTPTIWSDPANEETLRKGWADGLSCSQIALQIPGASRNAIIGKAHRLGLAARKPRVGGRRPKFTAVERYERLLAYQRRYRQAKPKPSVPLPVCAVEQPCSLLELTSERCHWPNGDPGEPGFYFCGGVSKAGGPYCGFHHRIAYSHPQPKSPDARSVPFLQRGWNPR
jgi:GcrA cell cycle regulator